MKVSKFVVDSQIPAGNHSMTYFLNLFDNITSRSSNQRSVVGQFPDDVRKIDEYHSSLIRCIAGRRVFILLIVK